MNGHGLVHHGKNTVCKTTWVLREYPKPRAVILYIRPHWLAFSAVEVTLVSSRCMRIFLRMNTSSRYSGCFPTPRMGGSPGYVPKGTAPLNVEQLLPFTGLRPGLLVSSSFHCPPLFFVHQGSTLELLELLELAVSQLLLA